MQHIIEALAKTTYPYHHITVHASATRPKDNHKMRDLKKMHKRKGWRDIGYHVVIERDGKVVIGRDFNVMGSQVLGHNENNFGICLVGGVNDRTRKAEDNYTQPQLESLRELVSTLSGALGVQECNIRGHRDWYPDHNGDGIIDSRDWLKECPCFDVQKTLQSWK